MNCINGHSVLDSMKFCSVCGVALEQPTAPTEQPEQNISGFANNSPQLPEVAKKKSNKFAIGVILLILFVAWLSNRGGDSEATIQEQYLAEIKAEDKSAFESNDAALLYLKNYCQAAEVARMVASDPIDAIVTSYCNTQLATDLGVTQAPTPAPDASEPITQEKTLNEIFTESYLPISTELEAKLTEVADYALAGDLQGTVASCYGLKDLTEQGSALQLTGNYYFDTAWGNAMYSGVNAADSCIIEDFDSAATYISKMSEYIVSARNAID